MNDLATNDDRSRTQNNGSFTQLLDGKSDQIAQLTPHDQQRIVQFLTVASISTAQAVRDLLPDEPLV